MLRSCVHRHAENGRMLSTYTYRHNIESGGKEWDSCLMENIASKLCIRRCLYVFEGFVANEMPVREVRR